MSDIIVNKVIKGDETYLDLTNDTVSEGTLLKNRTAHNSEGIQIQGVMEEGGGSVTGVKGDDESVYRDGDVNITAANIGTYTASQIDTLLNEKVDVHGTDSLMTNAEHVKLAGIEAGAEENVIESISLNGEEITPVNKAVALSVIDKDVDDLTNYYKKSETDASLGAKQNIILSSTLSIGGQTVTEVEEALESLAGISKPMTGATSSAAGEGGFVPSPSAGDENKALFGDGTWKPVSGGGGHTILDEDGTTYPQRSKLQFEGCEVTDDSTNDITKIKAEGGVTGVKGNAESTYRTGNVNLTPAHVGAVDEVEYEEDIYGVNLIPYPYYEGMSKTVNGITFTVNSDGSVTANGTATGIADFALRGRGASDTGNTLYRYLKQGESYTLTGSPKNGEENGYYIWMNETINKASSRIATDYGDGDTFTLSVLSENNMYGIVCRITEGTTVTNLTFKPMLYKANLKVGDYRKFNEQSIQNQITDQINVLSAKNMLIYPYVDTTKTENGITFIDNGDGTVSVNGTATQDTYFIFNDKSHTKKFDRLAGKNVILSGCPSGGGFGTYYWQYWNSTTSNRIRDFGDDGIGIVDVNEPANWNFCIVITAGNTINNLTFKPMITPASVHDRTYVPYAMTNRELTDEVTNAITLDSTNDLNNITRTGIYHFNTAPTNSPESKAHCMMIVSSRKENPVDLKQLVLSQQNAIYTRSHGSDGWTSWYKFTGTVVS